MAILAVLVALVSAVLTAVLFIFVAFTVYLLVMYQRYTHIPQPKGASFYMGHLSALKPELFAHDLFLEWCHEVGPVFVVWFVHLPLLMVADPECVKRLSSRDVPKPRVPAMEYLFGQRFILRSVLTIQHYDDWKDRRRRFDISFSRSHLNSLVPQFNKVAREHFIDKLRTKADGQTMVDLLNEFGNTTLQMISIVAFGTDFSKDQYVQSLAGDKGLIYLMSHCLEGLMKTLENPLLTYMRFGKNLSYAEAALKVRQIGEYCIRKRLAALENKQEVPNDILTLILQTAQIEKDIDMDELVDDCHILSCWPRDYSHSLVVQCCTVTPTS